MDFYPLTYKRFSSRPGWNSLLLGFLTWGIAASLQVQAAQPGDIVTVAGGGVGDGASALHAWIQRPLATVADSAGNVFIADTGNRRIRKLAPDGTLSTYAGGGQPAADFGDGGPATKAELYSPEGLALDAQGDLYIADREAGRIRKVAPNGTITTVAGGGNMRYLPSAGYTDPTPATSALLLEPVGIAVDATGTLYVTLNGRGLIVTIKKGIIQPTPDLPSDPADRFYSPRGIALDSAGNLYVADSGHHRIRKIDPDGVTTTIAGTGVAGFSGDGGPAVQAQLFSPYNVALDASDNLFISDRRNQRIRKVGTDGIITTIAGTGEAGYAATPQKALASPLSYPSNVALDPSGNLYIADTENNRIRKIAADGLLATVAGSGDPASNSEGGSALQATLSLPTDVAVDGAGTLYITDENNNRIARVTPDGILMTVAGGGSPADGLGENLPATQAVLDQPLSLAADHSGTLYFSDSYHYLIRRVGPDGVLTNLAGNGAAPPEIAEDSPATLAMLRAPLDVVADSKGNVYFIDNRLEVVLKVNPAGIISTYAGNGERGFSGDGGPATHAQLQKPNGLAIDAAGNLFISDTGNHRIRRVDINGIITTVAGSSPMNFLGMGNGGFGGDGGPAVQAFLNLPGKITIDSSGNLYVMDAYNYRVRKIDTNGIISTVAGNGERLFLPITDEYYFVPVHDGVPATEEPLSAFASIAVDSMSNLYISDGYRIRKVGTDGIITTIAGTGSSSYSMNGQFIIPPLGDGGPATAAWIAGPADMETDAKGNLYIADLNRVRKIDSNGIITTVAGNGKPPYTVSPPATIGDNGPALDAFIDARGIGFARNGDLLIADTANQRVRRVDRGIITTVAGGGSGGRGDGGPARQAEISLLEGMTVDSAGNVYIADTEFNRVRRIGIDGRIVTVAGTGSDGAGGDGGPALQASLSDPTDVALDTLGDLYIVERGSDRIRKVTPDGIIQTAVGKDSATGTLNRAELSRPQSVVVDVSGTLFVSDAGNQKILKIPATGSATTVAGGGEDATGEGILGTLAYLPRPGGLAINAAGDLFIADTENQRVRKVLAVAAPGEVPAAPYPGPTSGVLPPVPGDANGDGRVDIRDATLALQFAVSLQTPTADQLKAADLNGDGKITVADVTLLLQKAIGL